MEEGRPEIFALIPARNVLDLLWAVAVILKMFFLKGCQSLLPLRYKHESQLMSQGEVSMKVSREGMEKHSIWGTLLKHAFLPCIFGRIFQEFCE